MVQRRFLIASSLARLIRKEQGIAGRIVEGYFPPREFGLAVSLIINVRIGF
jgi:hypothetical protein